MSSKTLSHEPCKVKGTSTRNILSLFLLFVACSAATERQRHLHERTRNNSNEIFENRSSYKELDLCSLTSHELHLATGPDDYISPCLLYDVSPEQSLEQLPPILRNRTYDITIVQVTPSSCSNNRDGAVTAVKALNADSNGKGFSIGFNNDHFVRFRFVAVIAGNPSNLTTSVYHEIHTSLLDSVVHELQPEYIMGTCSWYSELEKKIALRHKKILMAQVGPPGFYKDVKENPYVFGFHVNSDEYPIPALRQLLFHTNAKANDRSTKNRGSTKRVEEVQPIRVVYRTKSEFFRSTCQSVLRKASELGFNDIIAIEYDPDEDFNSNGVPNERDIPFLNYIADQACPPQVRTNFHPALFVCVQTDLEADTMLYRWRKNNCVASLIWMTPATWGWAESRKNSIPYVFGGGQWHAKFDYSDEYFDSGSSLIYHNKEVFGYKGNYDMVVSYAMPKLFASHIKSTFRLADAPNASATFNDRYEEMRRSLIVLKDDTIFGPFSLNEYQRNVGRGAAGTQWLLNSLSSSNAEEVLKNHTEKEGKSLGAFKNLCVSPLTQAEAAAILPAPVTFNCDAGEFWSSKRMTDERGLLLSKCDYCPVDTYTNLQNKHLKCMACPKGSTTMGATGSTYCTRSSANLLPHGLLIMGYAMVSIVWILALCFIGWATYYRNDPVLKLGQINFLLVLCVGAIISTSAILTLGIQADVGEDTSGATAACRAAPFLYSIGWVLQYSSLTAKSYRLSMLMNNSSRQKRILTARRMYLIIGAAVVLDLAIVLAWHFVEPLQYKRKEIGVSADPLTGVMTIESFGQCSKGKWAWTFLGPMVALHVTLMIATNALLYTVRNVSERYQEQKYVGLASIYVCEIFMLGIPVLFAVGYSPGATYVVLCGIIFLDALGMLLFIFIPKIRFQRKGLPQGVSVVQSILPTNKQSPPLETSETSETTINTREENPHLSSAAVAAATIAELTTLKGQIKQFIEEEGLLAPDKGIALLKNIDCTVKCLSHP